MVCARCIVSVEHTLAEMGIQGMTVGLGFIEGEINESFSEKDFDRRLKASGFELIQDADSTLVENIRHVVIERIRSKNQDNDANWSDILARSFSMDYSAISKTFSEIAGITLERYIILQKIERIKEWLRYDEFTIGEMAWKLGYSSPNHLSNQFKSVTGMSPTQFKNNLSAVRVGLDKV